MRTMSERKILAAIENLQQSLNARFDSIEKRLNATEEKQETQSRDIELLFKRVNALCGERPIWHSKDGREVAVSREDAFELFKELGFSRREALHIIDEANRLSRDRDGKHFAKQVRISGGEPLRAIVIFADDER